MQYLTAGKQPDKHGRTRSGVSQQVAAWQERQWQLTAGGPTVSEEPVEQE